MKPGDLSEFTKLAAKRKPDPLLKGMSMGALGAAGGGLIGGIATLKKMQNKRSWPTN